MHGTELKAGAPPMRRSSKQMLFAVGVIWLLGLLIALYAPNDVLARSWLARTYVDAFEFLWPLLRGYAQKSAFQEVALLYNSVVWLSLPLWAVLVWRYLKTRNSGLLVKDKLSIVNWIALLLGASFYAAIGVVFLIFWNGTATRLVDFAGSRLSLGVWGMVPPFGVAVFLTPVAASLKKLVTGRF